MQSDRHLMLRPRNGITGASAIGLPGSPSAGVEIDMQLRLHSVELLPQGPAGGIRSAGNELGYASFGAGMQYFLSDSDIAPFVGGGLELAYFQANMANTSD